MCYRAGAFDWADAQIYVFSDASRAGELDIGAGDLEPMRSQSGRIIALGPPGAVQSGSATTLHLLDWTSSVIRRVCRSTLQAEAYALTSAVELANQVRCLLYEMEQKPAEVRLNNDDAARHGRTLVWLTDCRSLYDTVQKEGPAKVGDKRLLIDILALRQDLWRTRNSCGHQDPLMDDARPAADQRTDEIFWIDTAVMAADSLTKFMDSQDLRDLCTTGYWDFTQPEASAQLKARKAESRKSARGHAAAKEQ